MSTEDFDNDKVTELFSFTKPTKKTENNFPIEEDNPFLTSSPPEPKEEGFHNIIEDDEDFIKNPTDFSDPAAEEKALKKRNMTILITTAIFALILISFFIWKNFDKNNDNKQTIATQGPTPTSTAKVTDSSTTKPLLKQYPNAPRVDQSERMISINKNIATDGKNGNLILINGAITAANTPCRTIEPTDFCLVGKGALSDKTGFDIYYLKDGVNSRLFENPENFKKITLKGYPSAGVMDLLLGNSKAQTVVAINPNSSGWMLVLDPNSRLESVVAAVKAR